MELQFYKQPFRNSEYGSQIYDATDNFICQFETLWNDKGDFADGEKELRIKIVECLNSKELTPLFDDLVHTNGEIFTNDRHLLTIRGWGGLTGTGGHHFTAEKAAKIQDDFADWLIYKLKK